MNKRISLGAAVTLIIVAIAATFSVTFVIAMRNFDYNLKQVSKRQEMFEYITLVDKDVRQNYYGKINEDKLREALAKGYISGIGDP
ncbi:MAG: peptidase S41, partial [Clostridiales bacterium]|nr:peptidase S41 [Clostridiales bacterium]